MANLKKAIENQAWPSRVEAMAKLLPLHFSTPIRGLELGVWYGLGSTRIWIQTAPQGSTFLFVDAWEDIFTTQTDLESEFPHHQVSSQLTDAFLSAYLSLKREAYARRESGSPIETILINGPGSSALPALAENSFDFIYIDGDHHYKQVKQDIQNSKKLIKKDFGIIAGDDLEIPPTERLAELAGNFPDADFVRLEGEGSPWCHPGVLKAVWEEFGEAVNHDNGFWWVIVRESGYSSS